MTPEAAPAADAPVADVPAAARPGVLSEARVLFRTTDADRGVIGCPTLTPHLEARPIGGEALLLVSETFSASLYGGLYGRLADLLDGSLTHDEIVDRLSGEFAPVKIKTALVSMATKGYAVSAAFSMDRGQAAFWSSMGASPRYVEARFAETVVEITGPAGSAELAAVLNELGVRTTTGSGTGDLVVVTTHDYLDDVHDRRNRAQLAAGRPWLLVRPGGLAPMVGPVFRGGDGPCWACLAHRYGGNREIDNFLRNVAASASPTVRPRADSPAMARALLAIAAGEIAKWIVFGEPSPIANDVLTFDPIGFGAAHHPVARRPQCAVCGAPELHRPDRAPVPVTFRSRPKPMRNSGGVRAVPPEETVRRYRHLVSPVSGVVTQLLRTSDTKDDWLHVYWAGSNLALKNDSLRLLRTSLRTKSSGKGSSPAQAEASALCEAVERYSGVFHGDEIRRRCRFVDFAEGDAIHPNAVQLFSDRQFDDADRINARGSRFNYVPARFDPETEMDWTPVWSVTEGRFRHLPTMMLYYSMPTGGGPVYCGPDSNGCAAGNTLEEAVLQGFLELVERDAFACWWYNRVRRPRVDLSSFDDPYLTGAAAYYRAFERDLWLLDVTNDFGVPVFVAVSRRTDKAVEDIIFSAGAHFDPQIAALRAVCELNQYLPAVRDVKGDGDRYMYDDPESVWWWRNATLATQPYLAPDEGAPTRRAGDFPRYETDDILHDVERCRRLIESRGLEMLVLDQTRPDIGLPVAKVIVPGMRHFWSRFGAGRLFDVPVALGWLDRPREEDQLNPIGVFI